MNRLVEKIKELIDLLTFGDVIFFVVMILLLILGVITICYMTNSKKSLREFTDEKDEKAEIEAQRKVMLKKKLNIVDEEKDNIEVFGLEEDKNTEKLEDLVATEEKTIEEQIINMDAFDDEMLPPAEDEPEELIDLNTLELAIKNQDFSNINIDKYEEEQEEKAIISYEELLEATGSFKINYEEETEDEGITVKKVDLNNFAVDDDYEYESFKLDEERVGVPVISYEKEESFLAALKDLQKMIT